MDADLHRTGDEESSELGSRSTCRNGWNFVKVDFFRIDVQKQCNKNDPRREHLEKKQRESVWSMVRANKRNSKTTTRRESLSFQPIYPLYMGENWSVPLRCWIFF